MTAVRLAAGLLGLGLALACTAASALPSTFGPVIGSALLCRSELDNAYFYRYLTAAFGPAYKHEGGAWWFKPEATLWGQPVLELMVGDDSSEHVFVAAVLDTQPEALEEAVRAATGLVHRVQGTSPTPLRMSNPGSVIAYHQGKSKIYCAKYQPLPTGR